MKLGICILILLMRVVAEAQTNEATVSMKAYVDMQAELTRELAKVQADHIIRSQDIRFDNVEKNVEKANTANEKRFDGVNEFRSQLKDQASTFVTWQALLGLMFGLSGVLFGYANIMNRKREREEKEKENASGKSIMSGDKVEVKK